MEKTIRYVAIRHRLHEWGLFEEGVVGYGSPLLSLYVTATEASDALTEALGEGTIEAGDGALAIGRVEIIPAKVLVVAPEALNETSLGPLRPSANKGRKASKAKRKQGAARYNDEAFGP